MSAKNSEDISRISVVNNDEFGVVEDDVEITEDEKKEFIQMNEEELLQGLFEAIDYTNSEESKKQIVIQRNGKRLFVFCIKPLTEEESNALRKKHTKYVKNKITGTKVSGETDLIKFRSEVIYKATVPEDRERIWDNKKAWQKANVVRAIDFIDAVLLGGEKERICDEIDRISGYINTNFEEVAKN